MLFGFGWKCVGFLLFLFELDFVLMWFIVMFSVLWFLGESVLRDMSGVMNCLWIEVMDFIFFKGIVLFRGLIVKRLCRWIGGFVCIFLEYCF